jgi:hypothetical protein
MAEVRVFVRTADQTRKAEVTMTRENTGGDVVQAAVSNWALPVDTDYSLVNVSRQKSIPANQALSDETVKDGDILEVQPVLVAGTCDGRKR